jgi:Tol biopolymer transport system component
MSVRSILFAYHRLLLVPLLAALLAACGAPAATNDAAQPTAPASTATPAPTAAPEPTVAPAATSAPAAAGVLPAPLYMFDDQQQIVRLEADGKTTAQITQEKEPIVQFSVSPADGAILYVVGQLGPQTQPTTQRLVRVDAQGGNQVELLKGALFAPVWTPDGQRYAVTWQDGPAGTGVYAGPATGGDPAQLVADLPLPKDGAKPGLRYSPLAWSPNGERLLLTAVPDYGPDAPAGDVSVLGLAVIGQGGQVSTLVEPGGNPNLCFDASWSNDGAYVYCANYGAFGDQPGLWRIPAAGGKPEVLLAGKDGQQTDVFNARQIDGQLYAFVAQFENGNAAPTYAMERFGADGSAPARLRDDAYDTTAVLWSAWAPDGSGAVIQKAEQGQTSNALIWAPAGSGAPVTLGARAFGAPQWGVARP